MDSFLESDEEENTITKQQIAEDDDGMESYDEDPSENEDIEAIPNSNNTNSNEIESSSDEDLNYSFTLDDIDWNKVAATKGENVEIIESDDKNNPPLLIKHLTKVVNKPLLSQKLKELQSKTCNLSWFETLSISTAPNKSNKNLNPNKLKNNDIKREIHFYQQTLSSVQTALKRIKSEIPNGDKLIQRPNDFYAEMIKTDDHMKKIKGRILWEQKKIGIVENRKKNKRLKKYHKQLMSNKIAENAKKIKSEAEALEEWKNSTNRDDRSLQQILKDARSAYQNKESLKGKKKPNMKRIIKNLKYGSGYTYKGLKGKNKNRNTYSSSLNFQSDWRRSKVAEQKEQSRQGGGFARGSKRFNSNYKRRNDERKGIVRGGHAGNRPRGNNKGNVNGYNNNVKRQNRILGKNKKRGSQRRPGKNTRQRMNRR